MSTNYVTSPDGTRIAYDLQGHGPYLVLLHGLGKTRADWRKAGYVERLKETNTMITVDCRGTGDSDRLTDAAGFGIDRVCADVMAVVDACHAPQFALWGYSLGGNIARYLAAYTKRVSALAVIGVPCFGPAVDSEFAQYIDEFSAKWQPLVDAYQQGRLGSDVPANERKPIASGQIPTWLACLEAMRSWPAIEPADIRCPMMLLFGDRNKMAYRWVQSHRQVLVDNHVHLEMLARLNHQQEFSQIDKVFPLVSAFFNNHILGVE